MLRHWWKVLRTVVVAVGVAFSFFAVIEILRAYETLYNVHPAVGVGFLILLGCGAAWLVGYLVVNVASRPPVLRPPVIIDRDHPTDRERRRYGRYVVKYIDRLGNNPSLPAEDRDRAKRGKERLAATLRMSDGEGPLLAAIHEAEDETLKPLVGQLDEQAKRQVRDSMRDVMVAVTISPYRAVDLMTVLYRNFAMVVRIIRIYNSRPRFREQLRIFADTMNVVATVNYLEMGKSLLEGLGSRLPLIGKFTDDIAQGICAIRDILLFQREDVLPSLFGDCFEMQAWNSDPSAIRI